MTYQLENFCEDCRNAYDPATGKADLEVVRTSLEKLLENPDFVETHCGQEAQYGVHTLYQDPEKDFMVLAHINKKSRTSPPHDHGASWAIYGQATGYTDMTDYQRNDDASVHGSADLEETKTYRLDPGMAGKFGPHQIHSIHFPDNARFIRVTGTNLSNIETLRYDMENHKVITVTPSRGSQAAGFASQ